MSKYQLSHLSDGTLLSGLKTLVARDREITAELLAHIAETDARKLYLSAAYPSMFAYCVGELGLSEDAAAKRIQAARAARRFPTIFEAVATGRLHLTAVGLLAPHLTQHTAEDLLKAATHRTKADIERLLAERFPSRRLRPGYNRSRSLLLSPVAASMRWRMFTPLLSPVAASMRWRMFTRLQELLKRRPSRGHPL